MKHTDFGIVPVDWRVSTIQELLDDNSILSHLDGNHGELYPKSHEFTKYGVPYIAANDFASGNVNFEKCKFLSESRASVFKKGIAQDGDVLFAHNATVGPVALLKTKLKNVILSTTVTYYRCNPDRISNLFLLYVLQSQFFVKQYKAVMMQSTRAQVPITAQRKFSIFLPIISEQTAIATGLSDADAIIRKLEQLIVKKRHVKAGAMQKLLMPNADWEVKKLGEICNRITTGKLDANAMRANGDYRFYTCAKDYFFINKYAFDDEALLISGNGENVGYVHYYKGKFNAYQRTYVLTGFALNVHFMKRYLDKYLSARIEVEVNAGNTPYIRMNTLTDMDVFFPKEESEQSRIAQILIDIDEEILKLENQLEKYRMLKRGMMQVLLTGKIRLV